MITLDVLMPGMDGWAVLAALKADPALADIPVIMLTILDDRNLGFALGAADYLTKPIDRERLVGVLRTLPPRPARSSSSTTMPDARAGCAGARARGWTVIEAENGRAALDRLRERDARRDPARPHDARDGRLRVRRALRGRDAAWRADPVVVLTAKDLTAEDRERLNGARGARPPEGRATSRETLLGEVRRCVAASSLGRGRKPERRLMAKILLVEDNEMNRDMLSRRLAQRGYEVVIAVDGQEGVDMARAEAPALDPDGHEPAGAGRLGGHAPSSRPTRPRERSRSSPSRRTRWRATARRPSGRAATTTTPSRWSCRGSSARSRRSWRGSRS